MRSWTGDERPERRERKSAKEETRADAPEPPTVCPLRLAPPALRPEVHFSALSPPRLHVASAPTQCFRLQHLLSCAKSRRISPSSPPRSHRLVPRQGTHYPPRARRKTWSRCWPPWRIGRARAEGKSAPPRRRAMGPKGVRCSDARKAGDGGREKKTGGAGDAPAVRARAGKGGDGAATAPPATRSVSAGSPLPAPSRGARAASGLERRISARGASRAVSTRPMLRSASLARSWGLGAIATPRTAFSAAPGAVAAMCAKGGAGGELPLRGELWGWRVVAGGGSDFCCDRRNADGSAERWGGKTRKTDPIAVVCGACFGAVARWL